MPSSRLPSVPSLASFTLFSKPRARCFTEAQTFPLFPPRLAQVRGKAGGLFAYWCGPRHGKGEGLLGFFSLNIYIFGSPIGNCRLLIRSKSFLIPCSFLPSPADSFRALGTIQPRAVSLAVCCRLRRLRRLLFLSGLLSPASRSCRVPIPALRRYR